MYWGTAWQESTSQPGLLCQTSCGRVVLRPMCRVVCVAPPINEKVSLVLVVVLRLSTVAVKRLQHLIGSRVFKLTRLEVIRFRCTQCAKRF